MGLSEAQTNISIEKEILPIKEKLYEKFAEKKPSVIFIIVNKKINDRFFDLNKNNVEGVAVLDGVTRANRSEFYLIPQKVNRGTATPSLY